MTAKKVAHPRKKPTAKKADGDNFQVVKAANGTYTGMCLRVGQCAPFVSSGWDSETAATKRMEEHEAEHVGGVDEGGNIVNPMTDLHEFCAEHAPALVAGSTAQ